jgi:hypothetical protein
MRSKVKEMGEVDEKNPEFYNYFIKPDNCAFRLCAE